MEFGFKLILPSSSDRRPLQFITRDRQALSTARYSRAGRLATADICVATGHLLLAKFSLMGGSVAEWLACWTQAQKARVQIAVATLSGSSLKQTVHTYCASVHQAAKLVAALLRVAGVTAGLVESNGSLPSGL